MQNDVARGRHGDGVGPLKLGQGARDGFDGQAEVIGDIGPRHGQVHRVASRTAREHAPEKLSDPLDGALPAEQEHVILKLLQIPRSQAPQFAGRGAIRVHRLIQG